MKKFQQCDDVILGNCNKLSEKYEEFNVDTELW